MSERADAAPFIAAIGESKELQYKRGLLNSARLMEERLEEAATWCFGLDGAIEAAARMVDALAVEVGAQAEIEGAQSSE